MFKIKTVYGNLAKLTDLDVSNVYDSLEEAQTKHPDDQIIIKYYVVNTKTGRIYGSPRWHDTYTEAKSVLEDAQSRTKQRNWAKQKGMKE